MTGDIQRVLIQEDEIKCKVADMGRIITEDYRDKDLVVVGILKGSVIFLSDLVRNISLPLSIDFIAVSSYGSGTSSAGDVKLLKDLDTPVEGKDVLIVEDILDSGITLRYIMSLMVVKKTASIRLCALLDKPGRRRAPVTPDYTCFTVPDEFLVGYGLDYAEKYRNLPYIGVLATSH